MTGPGFSGENLQTTPDVTGSEPEEQGVPADAVRESAGLEGGGEFGTPGATEGDVYGQPVVGEEPTPDSFTPPPAPPEQTAYPQASGQPEQAAASPAGDQAAAPAPAASPDGAPAPAPAPAPAAGDKPHKDAPPQMTPEQRAFMNKALHAAYAQGAKEGGGGGGKEPQETGEDKYRREQKEMELKNEAAELAKKRLDLTFVPDSLDDLRSMQRRAVELRTEMLNLAVKTRDNKQQEMYKQLADNMEHWVTREESWLLKPDSEVNHNWGDAKEGLYVAGNGTEWPGLQRLSSTVRAPYYRLDALRDNVGADRFSIVDRDSDEIDPKVFTPMTRESSPGAGDRVLLMPSTLNDYTYPPPTRMGARIMQLVEYSALGKIGEEKVEAMRETIRKAIALDAALRNEELVAENPKPKVNPDDPNLPPKTPEPTDDDSEAQQEYWQAREDDEAEIKRRKAAEAEADQPDQDPDDTDTPDAPEGTAEAEEADEPELEPGPFAPFIDHVNDVVKKEDVTQQELVNLLRQIDGNELDPKEEPGALAEARARAVEKKLAFFQASEGDEPDVMAAYDLSRAESDQAADEFLNLLSARSNLAHKTMGGEIITDDDLQKALSAVERDAGRTMRGQEANE